ncbi:MAG: hypothetical protein IBX36_00980 [Dehalococcoidia bacterium]|nr:hypothetical protein [Dehalococcoidia bacterium]
MGELKSAFEKAWEKAQKLGKLSSQEIREQKEEEYAPIGRAIAERYLGHGQNRIIKEEVNRYSGDEKGIVIRAALSRLVEAIGLESDEVTEKAMEGMLTLRGKGKIGEINERIRSIFREYREAERQKYEVEKGHIESGERELLHQLRISGSAVGEINPKASETWGRISQELYPPFNERLEELKREMLNLAEES